MESWRYNFTLMSILFSIGHAVVTAATAFASSQLDARVSYVGNAILNVLVIPASLLLAVPLTVYLGNKGCLMLGLICYAVYSLCFACAVAVESASAAQWYSFCIGCTFAGFGSGVLWTAQGSFLGNTITVVSREEQAPSREVLTGELATHFASWFLLFELICKILFSVGLSVALSAVTISNVYAGLSVAACLGFVFVRDVELETTHYSTPLLEKTFDTLHLWTDIRTWLLSPTNITFGMASAFIQGYFNANFGAIQLGNASVGYVSSFIVLIAVIAARFYGYLRNRFGTGLPLSLGALSFALIPILILTTGCLHWGLWLLIIYGLMGSGRGSYENTNKALFADTFPGAGTEPAFANCILQYSAASAVQYFLSAILTGPTLEVTVLVFAILIPLAYLLNKMLDTSADAEKQPLTGGRKLLV